MKSSKSGNNTSKAEVQGISNHGFWLLINGEEFFLTYKDYPWFVNATVKEIYNLKFSFGHHLHWPDLDIDLDLDSLRHPEKYPLKARVAESNPSKYGRKK